MKKFYFKITTISEGVDSGYCVHFSKGYLSKGEQGKGSYISLTARDEQDLRTKLWKYDFDTLEIVNDPIGE